MNQTLSDFNTFSRTPSDISGPESVAGKKRQRQSERVIIMNLIKDLVRERDYLIQHIANMRINTPLELMYWDDGRITDISKYPDTKIFEERLVELNIKIINHLQGTGQHRPLDNRS